jgi:outer membrane protein TolC
VSTTLTDVLTGQAPRVASLGPNILLPLYAGGALQGNEDAALARLDQSLISYRKAGLAALGEVSDSLMAYSSSAEVMSIQDDRVRASREVQRLAEMRFGAGTTSFVEVLDAQRQLLAAETDAVQSVLDRRLAMVRLYLALGGGWSAPETKH